MSLLPSKPDTSAADEPRPRVVGVDSDRADALMSALSSTTARRVLTELHDEPAPPSKLADRVDTSLQNVQYHLEQLEDAGAVEVVDTAYSEKGREMDIYAPADRPLVIFAGREEQSRGLRAALGDLLSGVAAIAVGSLLVQELFGRSVLAGLVGSLGSGAGGDGAAPADDGGAATATSTPEATGTHTATEVSRDGGGGGIMGEASPTSTEAPEVEAATSTATGTPAPAGTPTQAATDTPVATGTPSATPAVTGEPSATPAATGTPSPTAEATVTGADYAAEVATATPTAQAADGAGAAIASLPPGLLFFLGGLLALLVVVLLAYR